MTTDPESTSSIDTHLQPIETKMSYSYDDEKGWRRLRVLRPGRGIYHDIKRRLPYYWSDITDAWTYRTVASTIRMYFVNLLPAIAFTLDMYRRTGEFFGVNEALFSSALAAVVFSTLSAQPLTIVGVTGLISLFNFTIYDIIKIYDVSIYPQFMAWTGIWAAIFHWLVAVFNGCDYMRYVTDFSSESFGLYVGIIYIIKGVEELVNEFTTEGSAAGITAQARQFPLQKPGGFHWDFFLLGCATFAAGILGLPMPNGLVPQAPVHTDSLTVYKTSLKIIPTSEGEDTEIRRPIVNATHVVEQRLSHLLMGLALIGTMTGPLLVVLHTMPAAVFAGVFFVVGWGSIESNSILQKFVFLHSEKRFIQRDEPLLQVRRRKIWLYIILQFVDVAACVAISHTLAAIGFPVLIILLIPMRVVLVPRWFTQKELQILDDFTATNKIVLASLGGKPGLPEGSREEEWGLERRVSESKHGVPRQRAGSLHR
ncbi:hco3 transporter family protein [Colletotrichum kahawae]|uniref:Hco3 transporter family protein n=1 Tax=Colletotrichum kahawae TaxID=34407 RepID=A0AAE0D3Y3_COLKA|nr:hco3 transporter family protein [Colletotrichum kahawae]